MPQLARWLGALLVIYLAYPVGAFIYRVATGSNEGWNVPGLWSALRVSVEGATISVMIGVLTGIPLAYVLAHRRGWLSSAVSVVVQLPLAVPPLRQRREDVPELAAYFFRRSAQRLHRETCTLEPAAEQLMVDYYWPGNVRELENIVTRASVLTMPAGVCAGAQIPYQIGKSKPATPACVSGGMSGSRRERRAVLTPSATSLPS